MNLVKTYIDKSSIEGIGLFAAEFIPAGTNVWKQDTLDQVLTYEEVDYLPQLQKDYVLRYAYTENGKYILCSDNAKHYNHSSTPNVESVGEYEVSKYDINIGDEMTCDYFRINDDHSRPIFGELK